MISKIDPLCGLARGNTQWWGVLDLFRKSKIPWFQFLMDLKVQSTQYDKCCPNQIKKVKNVVISFFLFEIITNPM